MLAAFPELVHNDLIVDGSPPHPFDYDVLPVPKESAPASGIFWKASLSTKGKGEKIMDAVVKGLIDVIATEFPG